MMAAALESRSDSDFEGTVSRWLDEARATGRADAYAGKRRWVRYTWKVPVTVDVATGGTGQASQPAYSRDLSRGGLGLKCRQRIETASLVRVTRDQTNETMYGRVRHCTGTFGGFIVGIEFEASPQARQARQALRKSA